MTGLQKNVKQLMSARKKLLILVDWFAPGFKAGGPIRSCVNVCSALKEAYEIYVFTTDTDHGEAAPYQGIVADKWLYIEALGVMVYYAKKQELNAKQLSAQIAFVNADFIYLNHLFSPWFVLYPLWLKYTHKIKGKVVVCPRGALYDSALSLKAYKKRPLLYLYKWMGVHRQITFHATNEREAAAIEQYFGGSNIMIADNLPDTNQPAFVSCPKEPGYLKCIFIARIVPIKNLLYLLRILVEAKATITLTIAGPVEDDAYWQDCGKCIAQMPANITINYLGAKRNDELAALIQQHHLFILPTTGENFGHSIFEALLCGRPILISDQTPWLQLETLGIGWDIPLANPEKVSAAINTMVGFGQAEFDLHAAAAWQYAHEFINNPAAKKQYLNLFA